LLSERLRIAPVSSIPVYSKVFIAEAALDGEASYEIPANMTAIVRDIDWVYDGPDPALGASVWAYDTDGVQFYGIYNTAIENIFFWQSWRGRQVIPGPGFVYISSDFTVNARVSGYLLSGIAP
jgi:hypothetical protein